MKHFWDERFSGEEYVYGEEPNIFFAEELLKLKPGSILLPGEGEGRNAVYAALKGWESFAVDWSEEGKRKAMKLADKNNVKIQYHIADLSVYTPPEASYDAAALCFLHLAPNERVLLHKNILKSLKPGGTLILESFSKEQLQFQSGGPRKEELLYALDDIVEDFIELDFKLLRQLTISLQEGAHHQGKASVIRFTGTKPLQ